MASTRGLVGAVFVLLVFQGALPDAVAAPPCRIEPATGLPVPDNVAGFCVTESTSSVRVVQRSGDGLLVVVGQPDHARGGGALRVHDEAALLIYCPAPSQGTDCLGDFESLVPGPSAYVGFGTVQGASITMEGVDASCPSSMHAFGSLRDAQGVRFEFRRSLSVGQDCSVAFDETSLVRTSVETARPDEPVPATRVDPAAALSRLSSRQWTLLEMLLDLDEFSFDAIERLAGSSDRAVAAGCLLEPFSNECLRERIDAVQDTVDDVTDTVDALKGDLVDRRPSLRGLVDRVDTGQLRDLLDQVNSEMRGLLDTAEYLREGVAAWLGQPCELTSNTECGLFRRDLDTMISDLEALADFVESTDCLTVPFLEDRGLRPFSGQRDVLREMLDKAPPASLIVLKTVLDRVVPPNGDPGFQSSVGDWRTMFRDVLDSVPQSLRDEIAAACGEDPLLESGGDPIPCRILRPPATEFALKLVIPVGKTVHALTHYVNSFYTPDDFELTLEGVVAAGGGAGAQVPNILKALLLLMEWTSEKIGGDKAESVVENLMDKRKDCLDVDKDIEEDLRECQVRMSYLVTPNVFPFRRPTFQQAVDQLDRHVQNVAVCLLSGGCAEADLAAAQNDLARARTNAGSRLGFKYLCDAYCELSAGGNCDQARGGNGVSPERCDNGVDDNGNGLVDCADPFCEGKKPCR